MRKLISAQKILIFLVALMTLISFSTALTAKTMNGLMVVRLQTGQTIDKTITLINDNDVVVRINTFVTGNLSENIKLLENNFTIEPGETKDLRFTITATQPGKTENTIYSGFLEDGKVKGVGVGVPSKIIIIANGSSTSTPTTPTTPTTTNPITGNPTKEPSSFSISPLTIVITTIILTFLLLIALMVLVIIRKRGTTKEKMPIKLKKRSSLN